MNKSVTVIRFGGVVASMVLATAMFDRMAFADGGGIDSPECEFELSNGSVLVVPCDPCGGEDYMGNPCASDPATITCEKVCDAAGNVLSGRCRCICIELGLEWYKQNYGFEQNCPVNP